MIIKDPWGRFTTILLIIIIKNRLTLVLGKKQTDNIFFKIYPFFFFFFSICSLQGFPYSSVSKEFACNAGDFDSIPGSGRSPGEGNGNPLQYSCLEYSIDRGVPGRPHSKGSTVHGVTRVGHNLATKPPPRSLQKICLKSVRTQKSLK